MVLFDQLRISDDGKRMYINAHVNKADVFADTTIEKMCICLGNKVYEATTIDPESNSIIYSKDYLEGTKEINEVISIDDEDLIYNKSSFKDLFFVYIKCANVPEEGKCYSMVGNYVLGVTFDESLLYQKVMGFTKGLADECQVPVGFADFILLWNAFKAAVETEHFIPAVKYWNMLFDKNSGSHGNNKPCGCHG
jgi:hypothetical protein